MRQTKNFGNEPDYFSIILVSLQDISVCIYFYNHAYMNVYKSITCTYLLVCGTIIVSELRNRI